MDTVGTSSHILLSPRPGAGNALGVLTVPGEDGFGFVAYISNTYTNIYILNKHICMSIYIYTYIHTHTHTHTHTIYMLYISIYISVCVCVCVRACVCMHYRRGGYRRGLWGIWGYSGLDRGLDRYFWGGLDRYFGVLDRYFGGG
jgi:hypothetical protein